VKCSEPRSAALERPQARRRPHWGKRVASAAAVTVALIAPGSAEAAIDQQQNDASAQVTAMAAAGVTNCVNQTFTAGLSGNLDAIDLFLRGGTTYPLTIEVRTVGSGSLVSSGSVSAASVPDASGAFITIPLTPVAAVMATA